MPKKVDKGAQGYDLCVPRDVIVKKGRNVIPLDLIIELPKNVGADIRPRSGFSARGFEGYPFISLENGEIVITDEQSHNYNADVITGLVDSSYRGIVGVLVKNDDVPFLVKAGTRIAQMTLLKHYPTVDFCVVDELSKTDRGDGGFGHSGTKKL